MIGLPFIRDLIRVRKKTVLFSSALYTLGAVLFWLPTDTEMEGMVIQFTSLAVIGLGMGYAGSSLRMLKAAVQIAWRAAVAGWVIFATVEWIVTGDSSASVTTFPPIMSQVLVEFFLSFITGSFVSRYLKNRKRKKEERVGNEKHRRLTRGEIVAILALLVAVVNLVVDLIRDEGRPDSLKTNKNEAEISATFFVDPKMLRISPETFLAPLSDPQTLSNLPASRTSPATHGHN